MVVGGVGGVLRSDPGEEGGLLHEEVTSDLACPWGGPVARQT